MKKEWWTQQWRKENKWKWFLPNWQWDRCTSISAIALDQYIEFTLVEISMDYTMTAKNSFRMSGRSTPVSLIARGNIWKWDLKSIVKVLQSRISKPKGRLALKSLKRKAATFKLPGSPVLSRRWLFFKDMPGSLLTKIESTVASSYLRIERAKSSVLRHMRHWIRSVQSGAGLLTLSAFISILLIMGRSMIRSSEVRRSFETMFLSLSKRFRSLNSWYGRIWILSTAGSWSVNKGWTSMGP